MNSGAKVSTGYSREKRSTAIPARLPDAVANISAELPPSHREQSPTTPVLSRKEELDGTCADSLAAKRVRSTRTDTHTGPLRRSVRLQTRQRFADSEGPIHIALSAPSREPQIETSARSVPSERAGLPLTNLQQPRVKHEEVQRAAKQKPPKRSYASLDTKVERQGQVSLATLLRKRQVDGDREDSEYQPKQARLTQKNLVLFNKMAKKKDTKKVSSSTRLESTSVSSTTKTVSTTSSGFAIQAYKNGILDPISSKPPKNLDDIRKRLVQSRGSASPTESMYENYVGRVARAPNEATMVFEVGGKLLKDYNDNGYQRVFNQQFTAFPNDVGFNNGLSDPQPDFVEGLGRDEFRPFPIDDYVDGAVLYKDDPHSLALPHLAGEWKGRGKDMEEARLQSAYAGAALVYTRNQALSYVGEPDPLDHAKVTTFTTDGTNLTFYAHYASPLDDGTVEYHQYHVKSTNLVDSHQGLKEGWRQLRNEQDHARAQSYAMRDRLKDHWKVKKGTTQSAAATVSNLDNILEEPRSITALNNGRHIDDDDDKFKEPPPSTRHWQHKRTNKTASLTNSRATSDDDCEIVDRQTYTLKPS